MNNSHPYQPRNNREWFLYYLFNDTEFVRQATTITTALKSLVGDDSYSLMLLVSSNNSITQQLNEQGKYNSDIRIILARAQNQSVPLFKSNSSEAAIIHSIEAMAKRFRVSTSTIERGLKYRKNTSLVRNLPGVVARNNKIVIEIDATTRLEDIKAVYPYIQELQSTLPGYKPRNRSKDRPDLIYAIYKQRLGHKTFKDIYTLYASGTLPGYDGSHAIGSEDALERMYNKNKPAT